MTNLSLSILFSLRVFVWIILNGTEDDRERLRFSQFSFHWEFLFGTLILKDFKKLNLSLSILFSLRVFVCPSSLLSSSKSSGRSSQFSFHWEFLFDLIKVGFAPARKEVVSQFSFHWEFLFDICVTSTLMWRFLSTSQFSFHWEFLFEAEE